MGCVLAVAPVGCLSGPPVDNPVLVRNAEAVENPVLVSPGKPTAEAYRQVFDKALDVLTDYFPEMQTINPYDGRIVTKPRIAPGYEQFLKPGNPDPRQRLLATLQSVRQTATVLIKCGERGGFTVEVVVDKELEDTPRPTRTTIGNPTFQDYPTVAREVEVVTPDLSADRAWFKIGRDYAFEQELLRRIRQCK
jgi:hypothetical protein